MDCEILLDHGYAHRGDRIIRAMLETAKECNVDPILSSTWRKKSKNLMVYGYGHPIRRHWTDEHLANGGRVIVWDLGYWDRDARYADGAGMRLSIDQGHPWKWIKPEAPERWDARGVALRSDYDPEGPIILCGMGAKQRDLMGFRGQSWELAQVEKLRKKFPFKRIVYKPKRSETPLPRCVLATGTIEETLRGASLLVCLHSNVAVDACIAGVPARCSDGAAYALYKDNEAPSPEQRLEFLRSLAWWNWKTTQAREAWAFIRPYLFV